MTTLILALTYILKANAVAVPTFIFVLTWAIWAVKVLTYPIMLLFKVAAKINCLNS